MMVTVSTSSCAELVVSVAMKSVMCSPGNNGKGEGDMREM